jgi:hypothetical protein
MIRYLTLIVILGGLIMTQQSCQKETSDISEFDKKVIIDSAKTIVQNVFDASNNLKFLDGLKYYSGDSDAYYTNNGTILSLAELKESYKQIGSSVEVLENTIVSWNTAVLSRNVVAFTLPIHLKIKIKGIPEYNGQLVWSAIVGNKSGKWLIVQSHESWLNYSEMESALSPPSPDDQ